MLHILLISYSKSTFKNGHLEVDDYELLDLINILFLFFMKYFKKINFMKF